jgi:cation:H+ antiporter
VAAGTSLPEVATSIVAAIRGERDIAVGNVVGSNLFNLLGVLGISSLVSPQGVAVSQAAFQLDMPVMIAVAAACLPIFFTGHLIARWEGALFLAYYAAYTTYLLLAAAHTSLTRQFAVVMLGFVIPLTVIGLAVSVMRSVRAGREISDPPP